MKQRTGDSWMPAPVYGKSLSGLTLNLLVKNLERALLFQQEVLGATVVYADEDFAVLRAYGSEWMLHADHCYERHPILGLLAEAGVRGAGVELRLHGCNPDQAEAAARRLDFVVLAPAANKPHGLREVYLCDDDGYTWVADVPLAEA